MPIIHFHLVDGLSTPAQDTQLLLAASRLYADILNCPIDRVRAFIVAVPPGRCAVAGRMVSGPDDHAPYFEFLVLEGRPLSQRHALLTGFTDLVVEILGVDRARVRGHCKRVRPEEWAIGGTPASVVRKDDIGAFVSDGSIR